jgi:hypothetical protein
MRIDLCTAEGYSYDTRKPGGFSIKRRDSGVDRHISGLTWGHMRPGPMDLDQTAVDG